MIFAKITRNNYRLYRADGIKQQKTNCHINLKPAKAGIIGAAANLTSLGTNAD
ncbi:MAG TPA: hypothetical protein VLC91_11670 [Spongiibacteraceae bacterium]|nr:hypothetical protein [Spongiibacteraceae bacterium]